MVNEIIVVFLGTLPLDRHPESKPFTPLRRLSGGSIRITPGCRRIIPDPPDGRPGPSSGVDLLPV
jgi:hypothetical protein